MSGANELAQVKAGHWKVEVLESATLAAVVVGTPQSGFENSKLQNHEDECETDTQTLCTHMSTRPVRLDKAPS
jgi:hypothetical protein